VRYNIGESIELIHGGSRNAQGNGKCHEYYPENTMNQYL